MRVTLYEPALAVDGKAYAGWANAGDELFFPHVDSCCAVLIFGDKAVVGGHMAAQLPGSKDIDYVGAGRHVWTLVAANHRRLNGADAGCKVVTIGEAHWYRNMVHTAIWGAVSPEATLPLRTTDVNCPKGVDIYVTMDKIRVQLCGTGTVIEYDLPDGYEDLKDVKLG